MLRRRSLRARIAGGRVYTEGSTNRPGFGAAPLARRAGPLILPLTMGLSNTRLLDEAVRGAPSIPSGRPIEI